MATPLVTVHEESDGTASNSSTRSSLNSSSDKYTSHQRQTSDASHRLINLDNDQVSNHNSVPRLLPAAVDTQSPEKRRGSHLLKGLQKSLEAKIARQSGILASRSASSSTVSQTAVTERIDSINSKPAPNHQQQRLIKAASSADNLNNPRKHSLIIPSFLRSATSTSNIGGLNNANQTTNSKQNSAFSTTAASQKQRANAMKNQYSYSSDSLNSMTYTQPAHGGKSTAIGTDFKSISAAKEAAIRIHAPLPAVPSFLTILPEQLALRILTLLSAKDLCSCSQVCLSWYPLANHNSVWLEKCLQWNWSLLWPHETVPSNSMSYRDLNDPLAAAAAVVVVGQDSKGTEDPIASTSAGISWKRVYANRSGADRNWQRLIAGGSGESNDIKLQLSLTELKRPLAKNHLAPNPSIFVNSAGTTQTIYNNNNFDTRNMDDEASDRQAHQTPIFSIAGDQEIIVTSGSKDSIIRLWNPYSASRRRSRARLVMELSVPTDQHNTDDNIILSMAINDRHLFAGLSDGRLCVWNRISGNLIGELIGEHRDGISTIQILPNIHYASNSDKNAASPIGGKTNSYTLFTAGFDGMVRQYRVNVIQSLADMERLRSRGDAFLSKNSNISVKLIRSYNLPFSIYALTYYQPNQSVERYRIFAGGFDGYLYWMDMCHVDDGSGAQDAIRRQRFTTFPRDCEAMLRDDIINSDEGKQNRRKKGHDDTITGLSTVPVGCQLLASCSMDKTVKIWNCETMECLRRLIPKTPLDAFSSPLMRQVQLSWNAYNTSIRVMAADYGGWVHICELAIPVAEEQKCEFTSFHLNSIASSLRAESVTELTALYVNRFHLIAGDRRGRCLLLDFRDNQ